MGINKITQRHSSESKNLLCDNRLLISAELIIALLIIIACLTGVIPSQGVSGGVANIAAGLVYGALYFGAGVICGVLTNPPTSYAVIPLGQSDHKESDHWDDQAEKLFSKSKAASTYFLDKAELMKHVTAKKVLKRASAAQAGR